MDPNETMHKLIDAAIAGESYQFRYYADILFEWIEYGGFPPTDPRLGPVAN